ncbi:hypothetical protein MJ904_22600 [Massilia sp. MB5]|uniref:hypothetical protein n=1 Tax=Massilia sp. MB5 TaxID=2919578 RepID=UPI001F0F604E|nr:hypothetical protein [Massilia sp. MB5]UMR29798.1 hypothetical protein MJ904_22600 [Massilia sp. MB5]
MMRWQTLRHWWRYLIEPSLIKRLLLAQMALLTLLWSLGVAFVINESGNDLTLIGMNSIYDSFVEVTDSLEGQPEKQRASLAKLDGRCATITATCTRIPSRRASSSPAMAAKSTAVRTRRAACCPSRWRRSRPCTRMAAAGAPARAPSRPAARA